jgi:guanylate kinase
MSVKLVLTKEQFIDLAMPLHEGYTPAPHVVEHMRYVDATTVTGPAGVGKDTVIKSTGIPQVLSETTRDPRNNNGVMEQHGKEYFFRGGELNAVYADIVKGNYVQWAPGPNNNIYGSRNEAYPLAGPALIDVLAAAIPKMRALRTYLRSVESAYIVADSYDSYIQRFTGRGKLDPTDFKARLEEARSSLEFGLEDDEMHFIVNDTIEHAARNLTLLAQRHESLSEETRARNCGYAMLKGLSKELGRPMILPVSS